jgi:hypothetical protein
VDAIHIEVMELLFRPISSTQPSSSQEILDEASSPTPPRHIPDLNLPSESTEEAQDGTPLDKD